jgi:hypothetical protein
VASKDPAEAMGEFLAALLEIIFSLTFPLTLITVCGVSFALTFAFHTPEFGLWAWLSLGAADYARTHVWAAVVLGLLSLSALPLAWVAFREREIRISKAILEWVITALVVWFTFWLRTLWPYDESGWQLLAYGVLLFAGWNGVLEATLTTVAIVALYRANRPVRTGPPQQQPHGPGNGHDPRGDPETI